MDSKKSVVNVKHGEKLEYDECNTSKNCNPKAKISLIGIRRQKNGRYAAVITDTIRHKKVWLGTFDTTEEASQAYFSKKSEFENEKLRQQGNKKCKRIREMIPIVGVHKRGKYNSEKSEELVNVKQGNENVNCEVFQTESAGGSEIDVAISNSFNGGTVQRIDSHEIGTVEEAFRIAKEGSRVFNSGLMANVHGTRSSDECNNTTSCDFKARRSLIGIRRQKNGRYAAEITDQIRHKKVWLGTFDTVEEASQAYFSKKSEFENEKLSNQRNQKSKRISEMTHIVGVQEIKKRGKHNSEKSKELVNVKHGNVNVNCEIFQTESASVSEIDVPISNSSNGGTDQRIDSDEIGPCEEASCIAKEGSRVFNSSLMANVRGKKSSDDCNNITSCNPKAKISLIGIQRQKNGRYAAVITDRFRHKRVWLGTFDTVEEASQAYFSKKSEFEKLSQQGNKQNILKKSCDQIQQLESWSVVASLDTTASESERAKRIDSQGEEPGSSKATSCSITTSCNPKAKISLIGIRRRKSGRYGAVITDPFKHKEVCLGTFDSIEEASHAYLSKKYEFEKLRQLGDKENKPKKNCDQIQQPESPPVMASLDTTAHESGSANRIDSHKTTTHLIGAHKRKTTGRYESEIRNPITKKRTWLGTFGTAEEASHAYQSKKLEFQKLVIAKQQQCTYKQRKSAKLVHLKQGHENVNCEPFQPESASGSPDIDVPFSNSSNGGTVQSIDPDKIGTSEEPFHAYQSKKFDLELQSNMPTDSSAEEKQEGQEDDEDLWMGKWMQLPGGDRAVMFSLKLGLPIIDNYGSLLGEFSTLDDLSICVTEDDNQM